MSEDSLRPIRAAEQATDTIRRKARNVLDWLDHHECPDCGAYCRAEREYVAEQAMPMNVWVCPECDTRFYRREEQPYSFDMWR